MVIYLDSCCYNRPYDTADQLTVVLEAQCKLYIQQLVKDGFITLVSSYMVRYESGQNPYEKIQRRLPCGCCHICQVRLSYYHRQVTLEIQVPADQASDTHRICFATGGRIICWERRTL